MKTLNCNNVVKCVKAGNPSLEKKISGSQVVFLWSEVSVNIAGIFAVTSRPAVDKMNELE